MLEESRNKFDILSYSLVAETLWISGLVLMAYMLVSRPMLRRGPED